MMEGRRNFTLIEIIAVMMIFALVIGIAVSSMRKIPALVSLQQVVNELKQQCAEARQTASCQHRNVSIWYNPEGYISSEERDILLPDGLIIRIGQDDIRQKEEKRDLFVFFPDGSGQDQKLELVLDTDVITVTISPLTGRIFTADGKAK